MVVGWCFLRRAKSSLSTRCTSSLRFKSPRLRKIFSVMFMILEARIACFFLFPMMTSSRRWGLDFWPAEKITSMTLVFCAMRFKAVPPIAICRSSGCGENTMTVFM